jgi:hypothetical protein
MRFRSGVMVGLAVGYYFGTKAGRERYVQIERYAARIRASNSYQSLVAGAGELTGMVIERGRAIVDGADDSTDILTAVPFDLVGDPTLN